MTRTTLLLATTLALATTPVLAEIAVTDPYARASSPTAKSGAAFMEITNSGDTADRLIAVSSDAAQRVELHTHIEDADGVMRMVEVEDGFAVLPGETTMLMRGGKHVMFMGLTAPFEQGAMIDVTLTFENAGDIPVSIPVDLERKPGAMAHGTHTN